MAFAGGYGYDQFAAAPAGPAYGYGAAPAFTGGFQDANTSYIPENYQTVGNYATDAPVVDTRSVVGQPALVRGRPTGFEDVVVRVPTREQLKTVVVAGPVITRRVQGPPREVVRTVQVQGPPQVHRVAVQGPPREVVKRVQGPDSVREVVRKVVIAQPKEVVRKVEVQGPAREIIKRVEVQGPPREVIKRNEIRGPARTKEVKVKVPVPGPPREVVRTVQVPKDVVRQVVKTVDRPVDVPQPVPVVGPVQEILVKVRDNRLEFENRQLRRDIEWLERHNTRRHTRRDVRREERRVRDYLHRLQGNQHQSFGYGFPQQQFGGYNTFQGASLAAPVSYGAGYNAGYSTLGGYGGAYPAGQTLGGYNAGYNTFAGPSTSYYQ